MYLAPGLSPMAVWGALPEVGEELKEEADELKHKRSLRME